MHHVEWGADKLRQADGPGSGFPFQLWRAGQGMALWPGDAGIKHALLALGHCVAILGMHLQRASMVCWACVGER